ncbi:DMT family transporter [Rhodobacter sp. KR11]|uniref:DMT family transporter n=1 Tax=Rhodobacter sp. KR11 TaxID=2974588 RepID=UPI0022229C58|nr:DMT family transporter [Rhodobacter sp. KR11]MCW1917802.1 DMT family transporter [Rhodobacter sp. KR11]
MNDALKAALWMLGSVAAFTGIAVAGREVQATHDSFEIMTVRSAVGFTLLVAFGLVTGQIRQVSTERLSGHFARNIVHFVGQNLWLVALGLIPLAQVFAIEFTSPLWVIALGPLFLGERLTLPRVLAGLLGFMGILIVTQPGAGLMNWGTLAAAGAALSFATVAILTKRLTKGISVYGILFWLTFMQFFFGLIGAGFDGAVTLPTAQTLPWLCLIGLCGVLAHLSLTTALSLAPAGFVTPIDFIRLPLIAVIGALFYAEPFDPYVLLGGAVIFAGILVNLRAQMRVQAA